MAADGKKQGSGSAASSSKNKAHAAASDGTTGRRTQMIKQGGNNKSLQLAQVEEPPPFAREQNGQQRLRNADANDNASRAHVAFRKETGKDRKAVLQGAASTSQNRKKRQHEGLEIAHLEGQPSRREEPNRRRLEIAVFKEAPGANVASPSGQRKQKSFPTSQGKVTRRQHKRLEMADSREAPTQPTSHREPSNNKRLEILTNVEEPPTRTNERHPPERNLQLAPAVEAPRQRPHRQPWQDGPPQANADVEPALSAYRHVPRRNQPRRQRNTDENLLLVEGRVEPTSGKHWQRMLSCLISGIFVFAAVVLGVVFGIVVPARNGNQSIAPFSPPTPSWTPTSSQYPTKTPSLSPSAAPTSATYETFVTEISKHFGPNTYGSLLVDSSAQSKAARWLIEQDEVSANLSLHVPTERSRILQRFVLAVFFFATGGATSWIDKFEFLNPRLHECLWFNQLVCDTECDFAVEYGLSVPADSCDNTTLRMFGIVFDSFNNLTGTLPPELGALSDILAFLVWHNPISGTFPEELYEIPNMLYFGINGTKIGGTISSSIQNWVNLRICNLSSNFINGTLPTELGSLQSLTTLYLHNNFFSGSIPTELAGNLTLLRQLGLAKNVLSGPIPSSINHLSNLEVLHLNFNALSGTFPSSLLTSAPGLTEIWLDINELTGPLPLSNWLQTSSLQLLALSFNSFTGSIPSELGSLLQLTVLSIIGNLFSGTIPSEIGNLIHLRELSLGENLLSGVIPSESGSLVLTELFFVANNTLTGTIPTVLGQLTNMKQFYVHTNALTGTIPTEIGNFVRMTLFSIGTNNLSGTIPTELGQLVNVDLVHLSENPRLSGTIPSTFDVMEPDVVLLHATNLTGNASVICGRYIPEMMWADCDRLECWCCSSCV